MKLVFLIISILILFCIICTYSVPCKDAISTVGHVYNCNQSNTSLYSPLQCFRTGCWCVNITNGEQTDPIDMMLLHLAHDEQINASKICDENGHAKDLSKYS